MSEITRHESDAREAEARDAQDGLMSEFLAWIPAAAGVTVLLAALLYGMWMLDPSYPG
ncbi:hypothetical protein ACG98H_06605 [Corynebacterium sp. L4756]|uniref:hypothetical protein n=1 Tax=unclassified Corynebacterium TaxID=2624378 RepID=UPI00374D6BB7